MPTHTYPFVKYVYQDTGRIKYRADIPVKLINSIDGLSEDTYALIDTGADTSVIPGSLANRLGHNLKNDGVKSNFTFGVSGKKVQTYKHTFDIGLISSEGTQAVWNSGSMLIDCVAADIPLILGVQDFLTNFKVSIDYRCKEISVTW